MNNQPVPKKENVHIVNLTPATKEQINESLFMCVSRLISLMSKTQKFLTVCPSGELVSQRYITEKSQLEEIIKDINKQYDWDRKV